MPLPNVQTRHDIQSLLASAGLRPEKRHGQHFLVDGNLMRKLVSSAEINDRDVVLEVGGGTGGLTDLLAGVAARVIVVEIDRSLARILADRFADRDQVTVLEADVLEGKHRLDSRVLDVLHGHAAPAGKSMLVANLPYNVATPLLMNLLKAEPAMVRFCFTIQKEVGRRLTATAGEKDFGPLAITAQTTCEVRQLGRIPASAFWPAPKVESLMMRLDRKPHPFEKGKALHRFQELVQAAFAHRRKTVRYNLARHLGDEAVATAATIINPSDRAEMIPLASWIELGIQVVGSDH